MAFADLKLTNAEVLAGAGVSAAARAYRALVDEHGHDTLCEHYGLDTDAVNGGTHWPDIVDQAVLHGDINVKGELT